MALLIPFNLIENNCISSFYCYYDGCNNNDNPFWKYTRPMAAILFGAFIIQEIEEKLNKKVDCWADETFSISFLMAMGRWWCGDVVWGFWGMRVTRHLRNANRSRLFGCLAFDVCSERPPGYFIF
jgi:hypothetical protein